MTIPIIDAHHHVWRSADQPWLQGPTVPRIFGEYDPIKRDYPMSEFLEDISGSNVVGSVYVQTNWSPDRAVEEVEWVQSIADETGWPQAIVGFADLMSEGVEPVLAAHARSPLMRGVRQQLHWHENPQYRFASGPNAMASPVFRKNLARLQDHGWLFELQVFAPQMEDAAALVREFPGITFVLEHAGMLEDLSDEGRAQWREGMKRLADLPNMHTRSSATTRCRNSSKTSPAPMSSARSTCRPTGRQTAPSRKSSGCSPSPTRPAGRRPSSALLT